MSVEQIVLTSSVTCLVRRAWCLCCLTSISLMGCGSPVYNEQIIGPYFLLATDSLTRLHICRDVGNGGCLGRVPHTVFSVGFNDVYIVAKVNSGEPENPKVLYYYLNMLDDDAFKNAEEAAIGPLTHQQYLKAEILLGLPTFSLTIDQLAPVTAQDRP